MITIKVDKFYQTLFEEWKHMLFVVKVMGSTLPGSRTEKVYKMKLENSLSRLEKMGLPREVNYMLVSYFGLAFNLR